MKNSSRARTAAIVGAASTKMKVSSIYDHGKGGYISTSVEVNGNRFNGYDYTTSSHFSGGGSENLDYYDYENSAHVSLTIDQNSQFSGYDYDTRNHFSGKVNNRSISFYDYQTRKYYSYSI